MGNRRRKKLTPTDREDIAILCSYGYELDEIADELGLAQSSVNEVVEHERQLVTSPDSTLERLLRQRRSVEVRRNRSNRWLREFYASLPVTISRNGQKQTHQAQVAHAIRLESDVLKLDAELRHLDSEIADIEAKDVGSDRAATNVVEIPVPGTPELGDLPDEGGGLSGHGDGQGTEDDADQ